MAKKAASVTTRKSKRTSKITKGKTTKKLKATGKTNASRSKVNPAGLRIERMFTTKGENVLENVEYAKRNTKITNPDGSVVFEMNDAEIPAAWSQLATDIMISKYFRKAQVPQYPEGSDPATAEPLKDEDGNVILGPERSARQVVNRLAGCWRHWGEQYGYFRTSEDAQAYYDEMVFMLI
ncbi:MAG: hypothetical protein V3V10_03495, partial [Planctomycetota bacterium]